MSVVCFAGGFAFESRMVLLPVKSSYMCFCEFLPASPTGGTLDNSHLSSIDLYRMQTTRSCACNPMLPIKWCSPYRTDF